MVDHHPGEIPIIILTRPTSLEDPLLIADDAGFLFPQVLAAFKTQGTGSEIYYSLPHYIPRNIGMIIESWDGTCIYSRYDAPQKRLQEVIREKGIQHAIILTSYSYLIDTAELKRLCHAVLHKPYEYAMPNLVIPATFFAVMSEKSIDRLNRLEAAPINPFTFKKYLEQDPTGTPNPSTPETQTGDTDAAVRFLFELLYRGNGGLVPAPILRKYFRKKSPEEWGTKTGIADFIGDLFALPDMTALSGLLDETFVDGEPSTIAAQIHFLERISPYLPETGETFLEIGCGRYPASSFFLLNRFSKGIAIEPGLHDGFEKAFTLFTRLNTMLQDNPLFGATSGSLAKRENLDIRAVTVDALDLPDNSVDFCFSKSVFEHVDNVVAASKNLSRIMKPGSKMCHKIDFSDHIDTENIRFDFLRHDKEEWLQKKQGTNLWRINDFVSLWSELGFRVEVVERLVRVNKPMQIHECWRPYSEDDLFCYGALLVAEKR